MGRRIHTFLMPHSGPHFSTFWRVLMPKLRIFGPPWRPAGHQMTPNIAQVAPKRLQKLSGGKHVEPTCSQGRFRNAPGHHFNRFWMDSAGHFCHIVIVLTTILVSLGNYILIDKYMNIYNFLIIHCIRYRIL